MSIPHVTPELIEYLEALYEDRSPDLNDADRKIWFRAGQVDVVKHLRRVFEEQQENILDGD